MGEIKEYPPGRQVMVRKWLGRPSRAARQIARLILACVATENIRTRGAERPDLKKFHFCACTGWLASVQHKQRITEEKKIRISLFYVFYK